MNLEHEFTQYLTMIGTNRHTMNRVQLIETRKAFYAGVATMYSQFIKWADEGEEDEAKDDENSLKVLDIARQLDEFIESQKPTTKN